MQYMGDDVARQPAVLILRKTEEGSGGGRKVCSVWLMTRKAGAPTLLRVMVTDVREYCPHPVTLALHRA